MNAKDLLEKLVACAIARNDKLGDKYKLDHNEDVDLYTLYNILKDVEVYATHQPNYPLRGRVSALNIMSESHEKQDRDCIVIGVKDIFRFEGNPVYGSRDDFEDMEPYELYLDGTHVEDYDEDEDESVT